LIYKTITKASDNLDEICACQRTNNIEQKTKTTEHQTSNGRRALIHLPKKLNSQQIHIIVGVATSKPAS
jgi:hypothetical protein